MSEREGVRSEAPTWNGGIFSHFPFLAAAIQRCNGLVVEMGCGWGSTPLIHYLATRAVSYEMDGEWLARFKGYESDRHRLFEVRPSAASNSREHNAIQGWIDLAEHLSEGMDCEVLFLDQSPGEARVPCAEILKNSAKLIVCHDTEADEPGSGGNYGWRRLDGIFKYKRTVKRIIPWTTIYSNFMDFPIEGCDEYA